MRSLANLNKFKVMGMVTSALYFYLFISLLLFPESILGDFGIIGNESVYVLARRASMLMLGFCCLLFLSRNTPPSVVRQAISFSIGLNMAGFALMSSFELVRGFAEMSVLCAIVIEVLVATIYFSLLVFDRRYLNKSNG